MVVLELRDTGLKRGKSVLKSGNVSINTCTLQPNSISLSIYHGTNLRMMVV